ncbi:MAG TPA: glycosyltransferase [Mycobacteriales bacterium]|nr:glycosyltransferase [Mycobacteriales bacterium]
MTDVVYQAAADLPLDPAPHGPRIAVLIPCHNEQSSVARVVDGFRAALPTATIYVYDNASSDRTAERAAAAGAVVRREERRGKGTVVCRMFADVDADVYVLVDGDGTYDPTDAPAMADRLLRDNLDMVVGCRVPAPGEARPYPRGHVVGNRVFNRVLTALFGGRFTDVFSGYRVLSRRFVKSFPVRFPGFEIETELVTHTVDLGLPHAEMPTAYRGRDLESKRKLRTVRDGLRIGLAALLIFKEMRPLRFFTVIAAALTAVALSLGAIPVREFLETGLVLRFPTAILAASIQIIAFISLTAGIILDSVCHSRRQAKRLVYLALPAPGGYAPDSRSGARPPARWSAGRSGP